MIQVFNNSSDHIPWYGVMEIDDPRHTDEDGNIIDTASEHLFKDGVYAKGIEPSGTMMAPIGIAQEPINRGGVGDLLVDGITQVKIVVTADDVDLNQIPDLHFAVPIQNDTTRLQLSGVGPVQVLYRKPVFGDEWALAWLNKPVIARIEVEAAGVFMPGDASVDCVFIDDVREPVYTIFVPDHDVWGVARGGGGAHDKTGTMGYATWNVRRARWELLSLQSKLLSEGKVTEAGGIAKGAVGTVRLYWELVADAVGTLPADSGEDVEALAWCSALNNGDEVVVSYDRHEHRWVVVEQV